ncbi:LysR family transcriptional regulator [Streptococcus macacae]|uniref:Transcriptional regulator, LysR family n=1 Tax=Streptococcus macacae NCTC 11558 TaxID=764298 RepID=G5JZ40_9STRE|nr:LysR family transcriptional regulator [Streptococcus macacae]EHJ52960.1 transcriptional regulator, LysR family [Streptococcus macacae NCTC 11558]SUN78293.1 LysR family transcriptional regulator [Streptococcus macacae NCTC 11558]
MINLEQLQQLVTFEEEGTITKAAQKLLISQPALTRSLQKLEMELDIQLFDRQKNKTSFTETGLYTAKQARQLLRQTEEFLTNIHHQALRNTKLFIGVTAPGPIIDLEALADENHLTQQLDFSIQDESQLLEGLENGEFQVIITEQLIQKEGILSQYFLMEQLLLSVPAKHILAEREELQLSDLKGLSMLLRTNLGSWDAITESLTETNFIKQADSQAFTDLIAASDLPHFSTNITEDYYGESSRRINIPITDDKATKTFYISVLEKNKGLLKTLGL